MALAPGTTPREVTRARWGTAKLCLICMVTMTALDLSRESFRTKVELAPRLWA